MLGLGLMFFLFGIEGRVTSGKMGRLVMLIFALFFSLSPAALVTFSLCCVVLWDCPTRACLLFRNYFHYRTCHGLQYVPDRGRLGFVCGDMSEHNLGKL